MRRSGFLVSVLATIAAVLAWCACVYGQAASNERATAPPDAGNAAPAPAVKPELKTYTVRRLPKDFAAEKALDVAQWKAADVADIDLFPWYRRGQKQATQVRAFYDQEAVYLLFVAQDKHISAEPRALNGRISADSSVEFFGNPWPEQGRAYFNLEISCVGAVCLGAKGLDGERRSVTPAQAERLTILTTVPGPRKEESPDDAEWRLYVRLPRAVLAELFGKEVALTGKWRANFYRCGGKTDKQYATWNPLIGRPATFHRPDQFGWIVFE